MAPDRDIPVANDRLRLADLLRRDDPITWVFAGDSITHGALHTMGWRDYTEHFGERVRTEVGRRRDCIIKTGISGWRLPQVLDDLDHMVLRHRPQVVSVNIGMNDCTAGAAGVEAFRRDYIDLVRRVRSAIGAVLIVHTPNRILPHDAPRFAGLPPYADAVRSIAAATGALPVDHHADWESAERGETMYHWLNDAIHPNEYGHRVMARRLIRDVGLWDEASRVCRLFVP